MDGKGRDAKADTKVTKERVAPNLYLVTRENGRRFYVVRFKINGKTLERSLGSAEELSLRKATARAGYTIMEAQGNVQDLEKKRSVPTFKEALPKCLADIERVKQWRNPKSSHQWRSTIEQYALPIIGNKRVNEITRDDILAVLMPHWMTKTVTAKRLQQRLAVVFDWMILKKHCDTNPAQWQSNLAFSLPAKEKIIKRKHHDAPTVEELQKVVKYCLERPGATNGLLLMTIATVSRVSEVRQAQAEQIKGDVWEVPGEAQKVNRGMRRVPLTALASRALDMAEATGILFRGLRGGMLALDTPRLKLIKILGRPTTVHGIRSTFRDWCARGSVEWEVAERCLSHEVGNETERAYLRDDLLEKRRAVLEKWAELMLQKSQSRRKGK